MCAVAYTWGLDSQSGLTGWQCSTQQSPLVAVCTWTGVTCVGKVVTGLSLHNVGATGDIPTLLGQLTTLTLLDLSNNHLTGTVPTTLGNLLSLKILVLSSNTFTGIFPDSLCTSRQLQVIYVDENPLGCYFSCLANRAYLMLDSTVPLCTDSPTSYPTAPTGTPTVISYTSTYENTT